MNTVKDWAIRAWSRIKRADWRFWSIALATLVAVLLTFLLPLYNGNLLKVDWFGGAFFASWAAGVALFALVGFIVAVVSISRPERESFDARARNFLRRQSGPHIDYIVEKLVDTLEPYVELTQKKLVVEEWRPDVNKFKMSHITSTRLRGFVDDVPLRFPAKLNYISHCSPPEGARSPCVSYIRVNGNEVQAFREFDREVLCEFEAEADRHQACLVEHMLSYWVEAGEEKNRHQPIRFTRGLEVIVENKDPKHPVCVRIVSGAPQGDLTLKPGDSKTIINLSETKPGDYVYDFRILPA